MREFVLILLNIVLTIGIFYFVYKPAEQYQRLNGSMECMNIQGSPKQLCAQCMRRPPNMDTRKGIIVTSSQMYAGLKIPKQQSFISCRESLHLIDYSNYLLGGVLFERSQIIGRLFEQLQAEVIFSKEGRTVIQPDFQQFMIFSWSASNEIKPKIQVPSNVPAIKIAEFFFYIVNLAVLVLIMSKFLMKRQEQDSIFNSCILVIIIILELRTLNYFIILLGNRMYYVQTALRIIGLCSTLLRVKVRTQFLVCFFISGFIMTLHPLSLSIYSYAGWLLVLIGGWQKINYQHIWKYLSCSLVILSINSLVSYFAYQYEADSGCLIIELSQYVFLILAYTFLPDKKMQKFREYIPANNKPIYLSGYDQEQQMTIR